MIAHGGGIPPSKPACGMSEQSVESDWSWIDRWAEVRSALDQVADHMDEHAYSELSSLLDDGPGGPNEWAIEVTWLDPQAAGAMGPTSQYGPFETEEQVDRFEVMYRRDRDITATRVLYRTATYTPWEADSGPVPVTPDERERLLNEWWESINAPVSDPVTSPTEAAR